jgi:hypothetical protein
MFNGRTYMLQGLQKKIRASISTLIDTSFIFDENLSAMQDASTLTCEHCNNFFASKGEVALHINDRLCAEHPV